METNYPHALPSELERKPQPRVLLRQAHALYHSQFRRWFGIMAPTSLLSGAILVLADQQVKAISRSLHRGDILHQVDRIALIGAFRCTSFFLSWLLGCFALAAIATVVNELDLGGDAQGWEHDSYQRAREHFGGVVALAAITLFSFFVCAVAVGFVEVAAFRVVGWFHFPKYNYAVVLIGIVIVASIVSWLGAAIPVILYDNTRVWTALKKSVELSNGYEGALFLLVVESVAGSIIVWYAVTHGLPMLIPAGLTYEVWYPWLLNAVGVLASAAVEPALFIGLSLLANPERLNVSSVLDADRTATI